MARPIIWALGVLAVTALATTRFGETVKAMRLAKPKEPVAVSAEARPGPRLLTLAADPGGHFTTYALMDGVSVKVLVDTGATSVALPRSVASRAGLRVTDRDFRRPVSTANGVVMAAAVRVGEIRLDSIVVRNVEAMVLPDAALGTTLLGMSFLSKLDDVSMSRGRLNLRG